MAETPDKPVFQYEPDPEPPPKYPPLAVVLLLALPMAALGLLALPAVVRGGLGVTFPTFWYVRTCAILTALISIFLVPFSGRRTPWYARVNLLINLPGLALAVFSVLRWVVINMPS